MQHTTDTATVATAFCNAHGGKAWVARITGTDPKFGLAREFVRKQDVTSARSNVYRDLEFAVRLDEGAAYEWFQQSSSRAQDRGFWIVRDGDLVSASRAEVEDAVSR